MTWLDLIRGKSPHADELRGLTTRDAEKRLRALGMSQKAAKVFLSQHKHRLELSDDRASAEH